MFFTFFQLETCLVGNLLWMLYDESIWSLPTGCSFISPGCPSAIICSCLCWIGFVTGGIRCWRRRFLRFGRSWVSRLLASAKAITPIMDSSALLFAPLSFFWMKKCIRLLFYVGKKLSDRYWLNTLPEKFLCVRGEFLFLPLNSLTILLILNSILLHRFLLITVQRLSDLLHRFHLPLIR